jgi:glyoxylase-like metal-dependent hydrolase (beta-lactamase superfamily II)
MKLAILAPSSSGPAAVNQPSSGGGAPRVGAGDAVFRRYVGRTDLWGGDTGTILASIRGKLFSLPGDVPVVCGHGPDTSIDEEKRLNPFAGV